MRIVLDTNVLVSATLSPLGPSGELLTLVLRGDLQPVTSSALLAEAEAGISDVIASEVGASMAAVMREVSEVVPADFAPPIGRDSDDDQVVAVATAAGVDYVVTGDHDLLARNRQDLGMTFIEPGRMVELLGYLSG